MWRGSLRNHSHQKVFSNWKWKRFGHSLRFMHEDTNLQTNGLERSFLIHLPINVFLSWSQNLTNAALHIWGLFLEMSMSLVIFEVFWKLSLSEGVIVSEVHGIHSTRVIFSERHAKYVTVIVNGIHTMYVRVIISERHSMYGRVNFREMHCQMMITSVLIYCTFPNARVYIIFGTCIYPKTWAVSTPTNLHYQYSMYWSFYIWFDPDEKVCCYGHRCML